MRGPNRYSERPTVRALEKAVLRSAARRAHENGAHDDLAEPNCPLCDSRFGGVDDGP